MKITSTLTNHAGNTFSVVYRDADSLAALGERTEIKLIDPRNYQKYFDWGKVGERLVERAYAFARGETLTA